MYQGYPEQPDDQTYEKNAIEASSDGDQSFNPLYLSDETSITASSGLQPDVLPNQQPDSPGVGRLSRRKLIIAGGIAGGLAIVTSLGIVIPNELLQNQATDILGSFLLGNTRRHPAPIDIQGPLTTPQDLVIFSGRLSTGWNDWSWGGKHPTVSSPAFTDGSSAVRFSPNNYSGLYFSHNPFPTTGFGFLQFWINGGSVGGQQLIAGVVDQTYAFLAQPNINNYIQGGFVQLNKWQLVRIPLTVLQASESLIGGVAIRDVSGTVQPDVFVADIRLVHLPDPTAPTLLSGTANDLNAIVLFFDRQMLLGDVQAPRFYQISSLEDARYARPTQPTSAQYHPANKSVSLLIPDSMLDDKNYLVSVGRIRASAGPMLSDASNVSVTAHALELSIDISKRGPAISEFIYGVNLAGSTDYMKDLRPRLNRWGGTPMSRYNWKLGNAFNAGIDYHFENGNYGYTSNADRQPSGVVDQFIQRGKSAGVESLITIPTIGWVARDDLPTSAAVLPGAGGPPVKPGSAITIQGYDPTANRLRTSVPSRARKGSAFSDPPNLGDRTVAQDEWVYHLTKRFGTASNGGPRFYALDNEPELWEYIEHDVRPVQLSYEDMRDIFLDYASAIKDVDPTAMITAPIIALWTNLFYSSLDRGLDNFKTKADFHAHHDVFFLPWWLDQIRQHDAASGRRTLDVLDLHFFPQAGGIFYKTKTDAAGRQLRLRSTRALWDKTYKDESWINDYTYVIPHMLDWIQQYYPGTRFGLSEYSWGADNTMNGALAQAEVLGIFGREGAYMACHWGAPDFNNAAYNAFKMYSNFDNQGGWFSGTSIHASSTQLDTISCYATERENGDLLIMVLNKNETEALTPTIHLPNLGTRQGTTYRFGPDTSKPLAQVDTFKLTDDSLRYTFPNYSITLLKLSKA